MLADDGKMKWDASIVRMRVSRVMVSDGDEGGDTGMGDRWRGSKQREGSIIIGEERARAMRRPVPTNRAKHVLQYPLYESVLGEFGPREVTTVK